MARALTWHKEWHPQRSIPFLFHEDDKENVRSTEESIHRRCSSNFSANEVINMDDTGSMVSYYSINNVDMTLAIQKQITNQIAKDIIDWLLTAVVRDTPDSVASPIMQLYEILDDGKLLILLLDRCNMLGSKYKLADNSNENINTIQNVCRDIGVPEKYTLQRNDRMSKRIIGCLVLLSRACRSKNAKLMPLIISIKSLEKAGIRVDEMTAGTIHPNLEEMQLKGTFWVPDSFSKTCMVCDKSFGWFKHHCRSCGTLCCSSCSSSRVKCLGYNSKQRICEPCFESRQKN